MTKASDANRLRRLFGVIEYLQIVDVASVAELAERFGGSCASLYDDLVSAWVAEDPEHIGQFPLGLEIEFFDEADQDRPGVGARRVWIVGPAAFDRRLVRLVRTSVVSPGRTVGGGTARQLHPAQGAQHPSRRCSVRSAASPAEPLR